MSDEGRPEPAAEQIAERICELIPGASPNRRAHVAAIIRDAIAAAESRGEARGREAERAEIAARARTLSDYSRHDASLSGDHGTMWLHTHAANTLDALVTWILGRGRTT